MKPTSYQLTPLQHRYILRLRVDATTYDDGGGPVSADYVLEGRYEIQIAGRRHAATASLKPFYDPRNERVRR